MTNALIFGISGQDGYYLRQMLSVQGLDIVGVSRSAGDWICGDVSDGAFVESLVRAHQPAYIFHFAADSSTRHESIFDNHAAISTGTLNILESTRMHCPQSRVFLPGSAMQFVNRGCPIDEHTEFQASSPYSVARIQSVYAGRYYRSRFGLNVYTGYLFNHDSPRRTERHVNQKIAKAVRRIAGGSREKLVLGNVEVRKEFTFAGDIVKAIWGLVNQLDIREAVIGSGVAYSIKDYLERCFRYVNLDWQDHVEIDPARAAEYNLLVSNPARIKSLGWQPEVSFMQLVDMMMEEE